MERYYSTKRPFGPGTFPQKDGRETIVNFDGPTYCDEIEREAWGYIEYPEPLAKEEEETYELTRWERTYWCVTSSVYDDGRIVAAITNSIQAVKKPENKSKELKRKDIYLDWFDSKEEADQFVEDAKNA